MNRIYTIAIATLLIGLAIGAGFAWVAKPVPADEASKADLARALAQLVALKKPIRIGLVLATGGLGDKSFNDIAYAGAMRAKTELNITFDYAQPTAITEYESLQRGYASAGQYALIVCIGFDQADALNKTAADFPDQNFAIVDMPVDQPNVASLLFKANEGSFLVGVIGGMMTQTGKVGFVGGMDIPLIRDFFKGYQAGVQWANSSAQVLEPVFVGGWADPVTGKNLAVSLVGLGADAIFVAAGKSGLGALEGINEHGIVGFGVDSCQDYLYPPTYPIRASMTKRVDVAVYEMIVAAMISKAEGLIPVISKAFPSLKTDAFKGGVYNKGVAEQWTGCSRLPDEEQLWEDTFNFTETPLPTNVLSKLTEARDKIISGNITVPSAYT